MPQTYNSIFSPMLKNMEFSSLFLYVIVTFVFLIALFSKLNGSKKRQNLPPGPRPLPLIGNLLELGDKPHVSLANLAETYGPIMSLKLGLKTAYVISSATLAKETYQKKDLIFSTRFIPNALHAHDHFKYSVVWMPVSNRWRNLRKILSTVVLQNAKLNASQNLRREKVHELIAYAKKCCEEGVAVDIGRAAFTTSLNMLSNTIFSLDLADPSKGLSKEFRDVISDIMKNAGIPNLADFFPLIGIIDPQGLRHQLTKGFGHLFKIISKLVDERIELRGSKKINNGNDMLDTLLNMGEDIDRIQIERLLADLFIGGTDTTSSTVEWAIAEVLKNPNVLKRVKAELEETVGKGKPIEESDLVNLPFLRAIVKETLRKHPPGPLSFRGLDTDVQIGGYTIPKGSQVIQNIWAICHDPLLCKNPTSFEPERFMGLNTDVETQDLELIPFGLGRRSCPGTALALRTVPLMVGSLLNSFDWKIEGGTVAEELDMEEKFGLTLQKAQPLRIIPVAFN